jgi:2-polyprenyl-6-methoxyphenol hydroxylase-like FAD-dependent oxidoreductase
VDVVIVGAGPAGAATALLLARAGVTVTLVEREPSFDRLFRGEGLMPSGVDALLQIGPPGLLDTVPSRVVDSWTVCIDGREVLVVPEPVAELGARAVRVVSQPALLEGLVAAAARAPAFAFEAGARVRDLLRAPGGRVAGVRLETKAGPRDVAADLVLGCDGRGSLVRTRAGLALDLSPEQYDVLWCKLPAPAGRREGCSLLIAVAARAHPVISYTSWDGRLQLGVILPKGALGSLLERDWVQEAVRAAPPWLAEHVLANRGAIDGPVRLNVLVGACRDWSTPGLLLLGDAAHPMSPVRAQGVNLALRDAIVAANHLVPALRTGAPAAIDAACLAVQAERAPEVARAQALQRREAQGQGDARSASWRFALAKRLAPVLGRYRWAQRAWLARQRDLRFGSTPVVLDPALRVPGGPAIAGPGWPR